MPITSRETFQLEESTAIRIRIRYQVRSIYSKIQYYNFEQSNTKP